MPDHKPISVENYRYSLHESSIAKYPLPGREQSKLLFYRNKSLFHHSFKDLPDLLPDNSWLVFNNTKVIQARLTFHKSTGARIEVFCLEPIEPSEYHQSFESSNGCSWKCLVGNVKKWKTGPVSLQTEINNRMVTLEAWLEGPQAESFLVRFAWKEKGITFSEIIENAGSTPIPPYLNRDAEASDRDRYQTIYSHSPGSVAAPTAGLHFTDEVLNALEKKGIERKELTLHVGAGTFVPIKQEDARAHPMHAETVLVSLDFLEYWSTRNSGMIAVGTTSTRSIETLYWLGVQIHCGQNLHPDLIEFRQWENETLPQDIPLETSLQSLIDYCNRQDLEHIRFTTSLMIVPGYRFRTICGLITNFHMPGSTLLLLIAALIGDDWKKVYHEAVENNYRFLSYGDSSLLIP